MSSDIAIQVESLGKCFHVYEQPAHRLLQMLFRGRRSFYRDFWAVRGVDFTIARGETVGIIGRNGAGKSTLLQMICGTLNPTEGRIQVNGRVAALLELGAGFNPEFTGVENVYLAASLYGLTREQVEQRLASISAFADIGEFISQPVKTYSSGMYVRLAFAVIAHVDADILVIDEALSVGDAYFQQKCMRFLGEFQRRGGTLLFVSHDMGAVNALCASAILLRRNGDRYLCDAGPAKAISALYLRELYATSPEERVSIEPDAGTEASSDASAQTESTAHAAVATPTRYLASTFGVKDEFGSGGGRIVDVFFQNRDGQAVSEFTSDERVTLVVRATTAKSMIHPAIGFMLKDRKGQYVVAESTDSYLREDAIQVENGARVEARFNMRLPALVRGEYTLDVAFAEGPGTDHVQHHWIHDAIVVNAVNNHLVHGVSGAVSLAVEFAIES